MLVLYHMLLCPFARKVRVVLKEKGLDFEPMTEKVWKRRPEFLALNPAGEVPVLVDEDGAAIADSVAITEFLEERHPEPPLLGAEPAERAEVRRLVAWFDQKFQREVTRNLVDEKLDKRVLGLGQPSAAALRAGSANLHIHMGYIDYLAERRHWLAGEAYSLADIAAGAQLSCIDYLGDVPWKDHAAAKEWYARVKSRPSFRPILADHFPGVAPPRHYADPDF
ncbi:MAG: glutathione S-transferase family protein [Alphaproteobacteria bacterium]